MLDAGIVAMFFTSLISVCTILGIQAQPINWDADIIASPLELQNEKHDALSQYFGDQIQNETLFRSREAMEKLVGSFEDVANDR